MNKSEHKENRKAFLVGGIALVLIAGLFAAANQYLFVSKLNQPVAEPLSYQDVPFKTETDDDYVKADYIVAVNADWPIDNTNAISAETAAEEGARYLWKMFRFDLSGKTIQMTYATDPSRRIPYWHGSIMGNGEQQGRGIPEYGFSIDAVSGQWCSAHREPDVEAAEIILYDEAETTEYFKENGHEFIELAKEYAARQLSAEIAMAEVHGTSAWRAPGYIYEIPEWDESMYKAFYGDTDFIRVPYGEPMPVAAVGVIVYVTDIAGNRLEIVMNSVSKEVTSINDLYDGVDFDPDSVG